ncbi:accessory gland protein Acp29AB-like [Drosophila eugracilis]|uniref:accessory gland protein Acp29AB-like n=1 Tax=Drosophila eugracilis TaxID=29029 RepID=UPI001BDA44A0|nr:accessory gland protein Acp29AB-like [Drosophila eugracilis]
MLRITSIVFGALLVLDLLGSLTEALNGRSYVCLLSDPPNQCSEYCLSALQPVINNITNGQKGWSSCEVKQNETLETLDQIEQQLAGTQDQLKTELQKAVPQDLTERLNRIEGNQTALESQVKAVQEILSRIDRNVQLQRYQRVGSRYFYIEHNHMATWENAELMCNEIGGHLASFKSESEYNVIAEQLSPRTLYWTGINDLAEQGKFISKASGKPVTYLNWLTDEPKYDKYNLNDIHCVEFHGNVKQMLIDTCRQPLFFICQADDEV